MKRLSYFIFGLLLLPLSEELSINKLVNDDVEYSPDVYMEVDCEKINSTLINGKHASRVTVYITYKNQVYLVDLLLNAYLLSSSYVEKVVSDDVVVIRNSNILEEMCYYKGEVRDVEHSSAAFSTCQGIKGFFVIKNTTYHVTPTNLESGVYEVRKAINDNLSHWICGTDDLKSQLNNNITNRVKRQIVEESLSESYVVELYVAADSLMMNFYNGDVIKVTRYVKDIVNTANLLYQPLGFTVVLVGLEIWNIDQMEVVPNPSTTLSNWNMYRTRNVIPSHHNDVGFLLTKKVFLDRVLGLAPIGTMCASIRSGGIMSTTHENPSISGAGLAHELGHIFGLSHDSDDCYCESSDVTCIMAPNAAVVKPAMYFSSCSKNQLKTSINNGVDICLRDSPIEENQHFSVCGNGILEEGEECDCGRRPLEVCNPKCCNVKTCKLISTAKCASGQCCDVNSCQLKQAGLQCRSAVGSCDLAETCDGRSAFCPKNIYLHDGTGCSVGGVSAYCWSGLCRTARTQCQELYGPSASESNNLCYTTYNTLGTLNGFCSIKYSEELQYTKCQLEDALCGSLQCTPNDIGLIRYPSYIYITYKEVRQHKCQSVISNYGTRNENPGMVPNGASCGNKKMCASQKCVTVESILNKNGCPQCKNGICSNEGNCLCKSGYKGQNCEEAWNAPDDSIETSTTTSTTRTTTMTSTTTTPTKSSTTTIPTTTSTKSFNIPTFKTSEAPQWLPDNPDVTKINETPSTFSAPQTPTPPRNPPNIPSNGNNNNMFTPPQPTFYPTTNMFRRMTPTKVNNMPSIYARIP